MTHPSSRPPRRGTVSVEFAVVLPLLLLLLLGILEVGRAIHAEQVLTNAVREGGRQASLGRSDAEVEQTVRDYLRDAGLPNQNLVVTPPARQSEASGETSVRVRGSVPAADIRWINLSLYLPPGSRLSAESVWVEQ